MRSKTMTRRAFLAYTGATGAALALAACAPAAPTSQVATTGQSASEAPQELIYCYGAVAELPDLPLVQDEVNKVLPELREAINGQGGELRVTTPEAFGKLLESDIAKWRDVIKTGNIKLD